MAQTGKLSSAEESKTIWFLPKFYREPAVEGPFSICTPEATRFSDSMPSRGVTKGSMALASTVTSGTFYPASLRATQGFWHCPMKQKTATHFWEH